MDNLVGLDVLVNWVEMLPTWMAAVSTVVAAATAVTALTPTKHDDQIIAAILRILNVLSGNVGKNKNADDT